MSEQSSASNQSRDWNYHPDLPIPVSPILDRSTSWMLNPLSAEL